MLYDSPERLFAVGGALDGVSVGIDRALVIGFSEACDVVLTTDDLDDGSEATLEKREGGDWALTCIRGRVRRRQSYVKPGKTVSVQRGEALAVGDIDLVIARCPAEARQALHTATRNGFRRAWAASLAVAAAAIVALTLINFDGAKALIDRSSGSTDPSQALNDPQLADWMPALEARLSDAGLSNLAVQRGDGNIAEVSGTLRQSEQAEWKSVQRWFDGRFGVAHSLVAKIDVTEDSVTLPFAVESVWSGANPRVVLHDGSRHTVGESLPGGWMLEAIDSETVRVSRSGETLTLSMRGG